MVAVLMIKTLCGALALGLTSAAALTFISKGDDIKTGDTKTRDDKPPTTIGKKDKCLFLGT